jgi:hypothetical protein
VTRPGRAPSTTITAPRSDRGHTGTKGPPRWRAFCAFACQQRTIPAALRGICGSQSNGKILLGHYRHKHRHSAGDECVCHRPVTATRLPTTRPKAPAEQTGRAVATRHGRCGGSAASCVQVCRRAAFPEPTARKRAALKCLHHDSPGGQPCPRTTRWLTKLRRNDRVVLASANSATQAKLLRARPCFLLTIIFRRL